MGLQHNGFSNSEQAEIRKYLDHGLSGTQISKRIGRRKSSVLAEIRKIKGSSKQKQKITVKGRNSQTILKKKAQERRIHDTVDRIKDYGRPQTRYYAIISTERKFAYPFGSQKMTNILQKGLCSEEDLEDLDQILSDLYEEGQEPQVRYVDVLKSRTVSRKTIESKVSVEEEVRA